MNKPQPMLLRKTISIPVLLCSFSALVCSSCVNLQHVHAYSAASVQSFEVIGALKGRYELCAEAAVLRSYTQAFDANLNPGETCNLQRKADSVITVYSDALLAYLSGLEQLSQNKLVEYNYDALSKTIETTGPRFGINTQNIGAIKGISQAISMAITNGYRRKQLNKYISDANPGFKLMGTALRQTLDEYRSGVLQVSSQRLENIYLTLYAASTSLYEKLTINKEYALLEKRIAAEASAAGNAMLLIDQMVSGHQSLYNNRNRLSKKELRPLIFSVSGSIKNLLGEIKKSKQ